MHSGIDKRLKTSASLVAKTYKEMATKKVKFQQPLQTTDESTPVRQNDHTLHVWERLDKKAKVFRTSGEYGPSWDQVRERRTYDATSGELIERVSVD